MADIVHSKYALTYLLTYLLKNKSKLIWKKAKWLSPVHPILFASWQQHLKAAWFVWGFNP